MGGGWGSSGAHLRPPPTVITCVRSTYGLHALPDGHVQLTLPGSLGLAEKVAPWSALHTLPNVTASV